MSIPIIGITIMRHPKLKSLRFMGVSEAYTEAITRAGGIPVMVPLGLEASQLNSLMTKLDGLLLTGGGDIDPQQYQGNGHKDLRNVDGDRDQVEILLTRKAVNDGIPMLGVCRGHQMINVALGGTLYTHVPEQIGGAVRHDLLPGEPRNTIVHSVRILPGTKLHEIIGVGEAGVNSIHHQGVKDLAPGLKPTSYAPDGLLEGFEIPGHPFAVSVQWHPEWLAVHEPMQRLFRALVNAAGSASGN